MQPGERIGDYTIIRKIGEGGMSIVYLAEHIGDRRLVVVKQLKEQFRLDLQLVDRFLQGAKILQDLRHPHLARVFDCLEHRGTYFMVEEYLPGGSLADAIDAKECGYTEEEAIRWCRDALRAMDYAHQHAIVHRDLKCSNLMLDENRRVKVIDFGIARVFGDARITITMDRPLGTVEYMSPEQILDPRSVDHVTDVYSMGVVLYELLTGVVPFSGPSDFSISEKVARQAPPPMKQGRRGMRRLQPDATGIDPKLAQVVFRALEKRKQRRFGGCNEFAQQLDRYLKGGAPEGVGERVAHAVGQAARVPGKALARAAAAARQMGAGIQGPQGAARAYSRGIGVASLIVMVLAMLAAGVAAGVVPWPTGGTIVSGIALTIDAHPAVVEAAGTVVTFRYRVTNAGNVGLNNVRLAADGVAPHFESGDQDGDQILDVGEAWIYVATMEATQAALDAGMPLVTNVVARSDGAVSDPNRVEVAVKQSAALSIASRVNGVEAVSLGGPGPATFTYQVTNAGNVSLTNVTVVDQHGAVPVLLRGDTNQNGVLDVGETWEFRAQASIGRKEDGSPQTFVSRAIANRATSEPDSVTVTIAPLPPVDLPPGMSSPRKLVSAAPRYPEDAKAAGVQGDVVVSLTVGPTGRVENARIVRSIPLLDRAALDAVRLWVYEPPIVNGIRRGVIFNVGVNFTLVPPPLPPPPAPPPPVLQPKPPPPDAQSPVGPNGIRRPVKTRHVDPEYPPAARAAGVSGEVVVVFVVTTDGRVRDARVDKSIPLLDRAALDAVRQWQYTPATQNGRPLPMTVVETVAFPPAP